MPRALADSSTIYKCPHLSAFPGVQRAGGSTGEEVEGRLLCIWLPVSDCRLASLGHALGAELTSSATQE